MTRRTATRIGAFALSAVALVAAWAVLAPPELGGSTRYVILDGTSMEPSLHAGDLALVRARDDVGKGDVVLYEHPRLGAHVLHRIVRVNGGRYVLKGDNNDFLDDVRPTAGEIDGKLWVALPRVGSVLMWAREPMHAALIVFALAFFALGGGAAVAARRRAPRSRGPARVSPDDVRTSGRGGSAAQVLLAGGLAGLALFALLAVVSRTRPATRVQSTPDAYAHVGSFSYSAEVEPSDVYPDGHVDTGETVFVAASSRTSTSSSTTGSRRTKRAVSAVRRSSGQCSPTGPGGHARDTGSPSPRIHRNDGARGREPGHRVAHRDRRRDEGAHRLRDDHLRSRDHGRRCSSRPGRRRAGRGQDFAPKLPLLLDTVSLRPDSADSSPQTVRRTEAVTVEVPASLAIGALRLSVDDARTIAPFGLLVALRLAASAVRLVVRTRTGGEPAQIASLLRRPT